MTQRSEKWDTSTLCANKQINNLCISSSVPGNREKLILTDPFNRVRSAPGTDKRWHTNIALSQLLHLTCQPATHYLRRWSVIPLRLMCLRFNASSLSQSSSHQSVNLAERGQNGERSLLNPLFRVDILLWQYYGLRSIISEPNWRRFHFTLILTLTVSDCGQKDDHRVWFRTL